MFCFFWMLSLYAFVLAYTRRDRGWGPAMLLWTALGLGTITKAPVILAVLPAIAIYLACKRDLRAFSLLRPGWGALVYLAISLGWFIPALIQGGNEPACCLYLR